MSVPGAGGDWRTGRIAEEQAALRRVAMLAALGAPAEEVFTAVTTEVWRLLDVDLTAMARYDPDNVMTYVARWGTTSDARGGGMHTTLGGRNIGTLVSETGRPARMDDFATASGPPARFVRRLGIRSSVGAPILVEGRLWGVMIVASRSGHPLPADTETRLTGFTELVGTAIANAQARTDLRRYADEQAALRRVATLVASGVPPEEVYAGVAGEAGRLLGADLTAIGRYEPDEVLTVLGAWNDTGAAMPFSIGNRVRLGGENLATRIFRTHQPTRFDNYGDATGAVASVGRDWGFRATVGAPIRVDGRLWGILSVVSTRDEQLPSDTEARLAGFTELVGTAIANAQARTDLRSYGDEQAALRQVATLVATAAPPDEVFAAVAVELGAVFAVDYTAMTRFDADATARPVAMWSRTDAPWPVAIGDRLPLGGRNVTTLVHETGQPARIDDYRQSSGPFAEAGQDWGFRAAIGVPIRVGGRLWGVAILASARKASLPADTEERLAGFTELVGTAIANAEAQAALAASRARIVVAADDARRRIERDLHDGAQQRLVTLALQLREAQATAPPEAGEAVKRLDGVAAGLAAALDELREIARGIHPAILAEGGLRPALAALGRRCPVRVNLRVQVAGRLPGAIEIAAYYVVSEALTNTARHAGATAAEVDVTAGAGVLLVRVRDDGRGGADLSQGSGLVGLRDRVEALGGGLSMHDSPGEGTTLEVRIPLSGGSVRGC
ncbi:MAG TPA: GAF domain-containing protein [Trebonia sp.]|nr:GAF domain-containing protein [Trebonia sp.]